MTDHMDWSTFWAAIEALATVGTLIVGLVILIRELPKFRKELAARKVEGIRFVEEQLLAKDFQEWSEIIIDAWKLGGDDYPQEIERYITYALARIDFVAKLVDVGYVDKDLLFYSFSYYLWRIDRPITNFEKKNNNNIPSIKAGFPMGYALLKEASLFSGEVRKSFERLESYRTTENQLRTLDL